MTGPELAWQLRVSTRSDSGCGFVVTPRAALTCAHVVNGHKHCDIEPVDRRGGVACRVKPVSPGWHEEDHRWPDIACIDLPAAAGRPVAPLGALARPVPDTTVEVLGFPRGFDAEGQRIRTRVTGEDASGAWMQLDGASVGSGFSGAAALDAVTRRVVGMVAWAAAEAHGPIAWLIPLDTIAAYWPPLRDLLPSPLMVDPDFAAVRADLDGGFYPVALRRVTTLAARHRSESSVYYYWALAGLSGVRPAHHSADTISGLERLLRAALWLEPDAAHAAALWAVLKDDYYLLRGLHPGDPPLPYLHSFLPRLRPDHAIEILRHVPAVDSSTWQTISHRRPR